MRRLQEVDELAAPEKVTEEGVVMSPRQERLVRRRNGIRGAGSPLPPDELEGELSDVDIALPKRRGGKRKRVFVLLLLSMAVSLIAWAADGTPYDTHLHKLLREILTKLDPRPLSRVGWRVF